MYLPKAKDLFAEFDAWMGHLKRIGILPYFEKVIAVSAFTSSTCSECGWKSVKKDIPYDDFVCSNPRCSKYNQKRNRHSNAAGNGAKNLKTIINQEKQNTFVEFIPKVKLGQSCNTKNTLGCHYRPW